LIRQFPRVSIGNNRRFNTNYRWKMFQEWLFMQESHHPPASSQAKRPIGPVRRSGSYGIDAPYLVPIFGALLAGHVVQGVVSGSAWPFIGALIMLACAASGMYTSRRGKFVAWAELLDQLKLRGDERILDLGCGRGAVLLLAAQRLTTVTAVGVDLWRRGDQSGNSADAARRNAVAEGVADRVELHTADMTALPFEADGFDLVLSNVAIHNVKGRAGREKAIDEAVRVLRPGGRLLIADLWATGLYRDHLNKLGMTDIARRGLGWRMWWSGPWLATYLVTATKPPEGWMAT
jgi:arsenite methyltransferase